MVSGDSTDGGGPSAPSSGSSKLPNQSYGGGGGSIRSNPKHQQQPRFHGAFTGGFSAGYFNTVGSKEGWKPTLGINKRQSVEDFMDDDDHAEWGGPTGVQRQYQSIMSDSTGAGATASSGAKRLVGDVTSLSGPDIKDDDDRDALAGSRIILGAMLEDVVTTKIQNVGPRLLRVLGWRESVGAAIVPLDDGTVRTGADTKDDDNLDDDPSQIFLSLKRLRRIKVQSSRTLQELPPPKLDQCGLGFEPYKNAPEFERHRRQRQHRAQERALYKKNTYQLPTDGGGSVSTPNTDLPESATGRQYLSYETMEEFVGKKSVSGFALRDDEDDAYDDDEGFEGGTLGSQTLRATHPLAVLGGNIIGNSIRKDNNQQQSGSSVSALRRNVETVSSCYNTEAYEHHDSSDEEDYKNDDVHISNGVQSKASASKSASLTRNVFAQWAASTATNNLSNSSTMTDHTNTDGRSRRHPQSSLTSDGKPVLPGFILVSDVVDLNRKRYLGPDLPKDYQVQKHVFSENDHPDILYAVARAIRLENSRAEKSARVESEKQQDKQQRIATDRAAALSANFASLAHAMKNRFTKAATPETTAMDEGNFEGENQSTASQNSIPKSGLYWPKPIVVAAKGGSNETPDQETKSECKSPEIQLTRQVQQFLPNPLLCKRFGVPVPISLAIGTSAPATNRNGENAMSKTKEADYFETEILHLAKTKRVKTDSPNFESGQFEDKTNTSALGSGQKERSPNDIPIEQSRISRPPLESLQSIFEAESDESTDEDDLVCANDNKSTGEIEVEFKSGAEPARDEDDDVSRKELNVESTSTALVQYSHQDKDDDGMESSSTSTSSSSSVERRRKKKRKKHKHKHEKKRKKKGNKKHRPDKKSSKKCSRKDLS